jgi:hypothetical protein
VRGGRSPGQVALATRTCPHAAGRFTGYARVLVTELPRTHAALACTSAGVCGGVCG